MSAHLPQRSAPQRQASARQRFGVVSAQRCGLTPVAVLSTALFQPRDRTPIQRLRAWQRNARHTTGAAQGRTRRAADGAACCTRRCAARQAPPADCRTLALMDAATPGQRCTILSLGVVSRGGAIPTAWNIIPTTVKGAWRPRREGRCVHLHAVTPADGRVIVPVIAACPPPGCFAPVRPWRGIRSGASLGRDRLALRVRPTIRR